jgi:hypothetical protein
MANLYTIENLLVGKTYRSNSLTGEIVSAEKSNQPIWYGENTDAYLVGVRATHYSTSGKSTWAGDLVYRTIAVKVGE